MSKNKFIAIRNQADSSTLELYFLDVIGDTYDFWTGMSISHVQEIINQVNAYNPSNILVIIDSVGGDAPTGISIYNFLKNHKAKVQVEIIGLCCSISVGLAMCANKGKLRIAKNAFMMIHPASGVVCGTADEIRQGADVIDMYTNQIFDIIAERSGKTVDEISKLCAGGDYWMTGEEAVAQGFADTIFNDNANIQIAARLDETQYKNIPQQIRAQIAPKLEDNHISSFQEQINEMKNFFTEIKNAMLGIKPTESTDTAAISNQVAEAMAKPFETLNQDIETTITNKLDGLKPSLVEEIKIAVTNELKTVYDERIKALETANGTLAQTNKDLEKDITSMKGKASVSNQDGDVKKPIGVRKAYA